jgi:hypothetical protein
MKNPFTKLGNKFTQTFESVRSKIFKQRQKDAGTKKETHRGKGGGSAPMITANNVTENNPDPKNFDYKRSCNVTAVKKRRLKNKIARRSRRINRLHRQYRTKASF